MNEVGNIRGTIGRPIALTELRVVHPDTHEPQPDGASGLLLVRGPGVMSGYDGNAAATRAAFIDGWFNTGGCCLRRGLGRLLGGC